MAVKIFGKLWMSDKEYKQRSTAVAVVTLIGAAAAGVAGWVMGEDLGAKKAQKDLAEMKARVAKVEKSLAAKAEVINTETETKAEAKAEAKTEATTTEQPATTEATNASN